MTDTLFNRYKDILLELVNTNAGKYLLNCEGDTNPIVKITPNSWHFQRDEKLVQAFFSPTDKVAETFLPIIEKVRLYTEFTKKPVSNYYKAFLHYANLEKAAFPEIFLTTYAANSNGTGRVYNNSGNWTTEQAAATGSATDTTGHVASSVGVPSTEIDRFFCTFNTSSIGSGTIINGGNFLRLIADGTANVNTSSDTIDVVASTQASGTALATSDYNKAGSTVFASKAVSSYTSTNLANNDFTLNSNGDANISKSSYSKFVCRMETDRANTAPSNNTGAVVECTTASTLLLVVYIPGGAAFLYTLL